MRRAVFLDRDGTITEEGDWSTKAQPPRVIPGAPEALKRLQDAGFLLFVVTNQSGVARGYYTEADVELFHQRLRDQFAQAGVQFTDIVYCPHAPDADCDCRKPHTRFIRELADKYDIDLSRSWVIGDQTSDIAMGQINGCKTVLVQTGFAGENGKTEATPDSTAPNITQAASRVLAAGTS